MNTAPPAFAPSLTTILDPGDKHRDDERESAARCAGDESQAGVYTAGMRILPPAALILTALMLQGCVVAAVAGTAVGVTGAVVGGTAKVAGAGVRAVVPGDSRKD